MQRFVITVTIAVFLCCGSALAQVAQMDTTPSAMPLGVTSPLITGSGSPVAPTGLPLGTTSVPVLGLSPTISSLIPGGSLTTCSGTLQSTSAATGMTDPATSTGMTSSSASGFSTSFDGGGTTFDDDIEQLHSQYREFVLPTDHLGHNGELDANDWNDLTGWHSARLDRTGD